MHMQSISPGMTKTEFEIHVRNMKSKEGERIYADYKVDKAIFP